MRLLERLWAPGVAAARVAGSALLPSAREAGRLPDTPLLLRLLLRLLLLQEGNYVSCSWQQWQKVLFNTSIRCCAGQKYLPKTACHQVLQAWGTTHTDAAAGSQ